MDGLRRRRAEILAVARKRRAHRIAVFGSVARGEARPGSGLDLLVDFSWAPHFLIMSAWFTTLRNSWVSESRSSREAPSGLGTAVFAPRLWICDRRPGRKASGCLDHAQYVPKSRQP